MQQVRAWRRPAAQGFLEDVQHLRAYGVRHRRYAVPQGEVRRAQGLLHLFRDGYHHQGPIGKLHGRTLRDHRKDRPPVHAQGQGGHEVQWEPSHGRYGPYRRVRSRRQGSGKGRAELRQQEEKGGVRRTADRRRKGKEDVLDEDRQLFRQGAQKDVRRAYRRGREGHHRHMAWLLAVGKKVRHRTDTEQRGAELQGTPYHDPPDKIMGKDDLLVGKRFPRGKIFRRVLLQAEPLPKQGDHIQQPDSADGKGGQNLSERNHMQLTTDL